AQYFHLLRRQAKSLDHDRRPLVVMTPKSLLRNPQAASPLAAFTSGAFQPVLDDPQRAGNPEQVRRLVFCSGKIGVELEASPARAEAPTVAVARVELLAPYPAAEIAAVVRRYPNLEEVFWAQEEPRNMGAWSYMEPRLRETMAALERETPIGYAGRPERAYPAEGSLDRHGLEQARIIQTALGVLPVTVAANGHAPADSLASSGNGATKNGARTKSSRARAGNQ
ncbi:MAG: hypothetical protein KC442_16005, partial [Thermomicrobiales bacterium]|nr:hypothetical protein [Thermomicrobiales bacterium]